MAETKTFYAKGRNVQVVRSPVNKVVLANGLQADANPDPKRYEFGPQARLTLHVGQDMRPDGPPDPETGEPTMQDAIDFLKSREGFNSLYWIDGEEPHRPPALRFSLDQITEAAMRLETAPIEEMLQVERERWQRQEVIEAAESALGKIRAARAELEAAQA